MQSGKGGFLFGPDVMPQLGREKEFGELKKAIFTQFPQYWKNPIKTWKQCVEAVQQCCKHLRLGKEK